MVIEYAIDAFEQHPEIDEVAVVVSADNIATMTDIVVRNAWTKVRRILAGGKERYDSSLSAINAYSTDTQGVRTNLIFHDAARPLVSQRIISDVIATLRRERAVGVAVPCVDTILVCDNGYIQSAPDRSTLQRAQTPQGFDLEVIRSAYDKGLADPHFKATDDCGIVLRYRPDVPVAIVTGEEACMKVTYKEDTKILEQFINNSPA